MSRLEERIRYVVEGRQRVEQRLADLKAQSAQWAERRSEAESELETIAEQIAMAEEQAEILAAQAEEQSINLPGYEDALRAATARRTSNAARCPACSSRSSCSRPSRATSTNRPASSRCAVNASPARARPWPLPTKRD